MTSGNKKTIDQIHVAINKTNKKIAVKNLDHFENSH